MHRPTFTLLTFLLLASPTHPQVNIEQYRGEGTVTSTIGVSGGGATGNSEFFTTGATIGLAYRDSTHSVLVLGDGLIGFAGGQSFSNDGLLHLRYTRTGFPRFQPEAFTQTDYDTERLLTFRYLFGGGLRAVLVGRTASPLYLGVSMMYEHERLDLAPAAVHPRTTDDIRLSTYLNFKIGDGERWRFGVTGYYQPKPEDFGDQRILVSATLSNRLFGPLSQTVDVRYRRDSKPPVGVKRNDVGVSFGVEWRKGDEKKEEEK